MDAKLLFIIKHTHPEGSTVSPQMHNSHEIVYYGSGCHGVTTIDGVEYEFNPGNVSVNPKGTVHSEKHFSKGNVIYFCFDMDDNSKKLPKSGVYQGMWDVKLSLNIMLKETVNQDYRYEDMIFHELHKVLLMLSRKTVSQTKTAKNLSYVKNYLNENYPIGIDFKSMAKTTGYSYQHFSMLFSGIYGMSPQNYLINLRCEKACELLKTTSLSCTEIAYQCGFSDSGQMSKMFKTKYNKSPLEIRKQTNAENAAL